MHTPIHENILQALLGLSEEAIFITDAMGQVLWSGPGITRLLGRQSIPATAGTFTQWLVPSQRQSALWLLLGADDGQPLRKRISLQGHPPQAVDWTMLSLDQGALLVHRFRPEVALKSHSAWGLLEQQVFQEVQRPMLILNPEGIVLQLNPAAARFLHSEPTDVLGLPCWTLPTRPWLSQQEQRVRTALRHTQNGQAQRLCFRPHHETWWMAPLARQGCIHHVLLEVA